MGPDPIDSASLDLQSTALSGMEADKVLVSGTCFAKAGKNYWRR